MTRTTTISSRTLDKNVAAATAAAAATVPPTTRSSSRSTITAPSLVGLTNIDNKPRRGSSGAPPKRTVSTIHRNHTTDRKGNHQKVASSRPTSSPACQQVQHRDVGSSNRGTKPSLTLSRWAEYCFRIVTMALALCGIAASILVIGSCDVYQTTVQILTPVPEAPVPSSPTPNGDAPTTMMTVVDSWYAIQVGIFRYSTTSSSHQSSSWYESLFGFLMPGSNSATSTTDQFEGTAEAESCHLYSTSSFWSTIILSGDAGEGSYLEVLPITITTNRSSDLDIALEAALLDEQWWDPNADLSLLIVQWLSIGAPAVAGLATALVALSPYITCCGHHHHSPTTTTGTPGYCRRCWSKIWMALPILLYFLAAGAHVAVFWLWQSVGICDLDDGPINNDGESSNSDAMMMMLSVASGEDCSWSVGAYVIIVAIVSYLSSAILQGVGVNNYLYKANAQDRDLSKDNNTMEGSGSSSKNNTNNLMPAPTMSSSMEDSPSITSDIGGDSLEDGQGTDEISYPGFVGQSNKPVEQDDNIETSTTDENSGASTIQLSVTTRTDSDSSDALLNEAYCLDDEESGDTTEDHDRMVDDSETISVESIFTSSTADIERIVPSLPPDDEAASANTTATTTTTGLSSTSQEMADRAIRSVAAGTAAIMSPSLLQQRDQDEDENGSDCDDADVYYDEVVLVGDLSGSYHVEDVPSDEENQNLSEHYQVAGIAEAESLLMSPPTNAHLEEMEEGLVDLDDETLEAFLLAGDDEPSPPDGCNNDLNSDNNSVPEEQDDDTIPEPMGFAL